MNGEVRTTSSTDEVEESNADILIWNIGMEFAELRHERGLTQRQAAELLGTIQGRISPLEGGRQDLKLSTLARYADGYGQHVVVWFKPQEEEEMLEVEPKDV